MTDDSSVTMLNVFAHAVADNAVRAIEGFFSIFKRGMKGVYQHCGTQHLHRYLAEFDLRYTTRELTDLQRAETAAKNIVGKRLTYRRTNEAGHV